MHISAAYTYANGECIEITVDDGCDDYHPVRMSELVGYGRDLIRNVVADAAHERSEHHDNDKPAE